MNLPGKPVVLTGEFQRYELFADFQKTLLSSWTRLEPSSVEMSEEYFLICVGTGQHMKDGGNDEYDALLRHASRLTEAEIRRLVKTVPHRRLHLLVDDPDDPMLTRLLDLGGVVHCRGGMEDFRLIHSFQKVAIGQSAFQWWAAFLGAAREIYFPPIDRGIWSHPEPADLITDPWWWGIDLRVPNDARYIYGW